MRATATRPADPPEAQVPDTRTPAHTALARVQALLERAQALTEGPSPGNDANGDGYAHEDEPMELRGTPRIAAAVPTRDTPEDRQPGRAEAARWSRIALPG